MSETAINSGIGRNQFPCSPARELRSSCLGKYPSWTMVFNLLNTNSICQRDPYHSNICPAEALRHVVNTTTYLALRIRHESLRIHADQDVSSPLLDILNPSNGTVAGVRKDQFVSSYRQAVQRFSVAFATRWRYFQEVTQ